MNIISRTICMGALLLAGINLSFASNYSPRYFLTTKYSKEDVRKAIILNQEWVAFPS